jgi:hypothetical protein
VPNGGGGGRGCSWARFIGRGSEVRRQGEVNDSGWWWMT